MTDRDRDRDHLSDMADADDDASLVPRAVDGDPRAQAVLWARHRRWVAAILLGHRPAGHDLDDLIQEVAVIFTERLAELRDPGALRGWLRTVARNVALGAGRRRGPEARARLPERADPRAEQAYQRQLVREESARVLAALDRLPPEYREPLVLRSVEGWSQRQIAGFLGVPETTVETRLARGRRLLREQLARTERATGVGPSWAVTDGGAAGSAGRLHEGRTE